ncbi:hypothetical protein [Bacillus pseudomycoides]|uniref:hypothetical protein n=1 Tax=Bacillus pseudomycoides TaxID=64104 RepID=UPI000BEF7970|nr:hypothetical protein [Bacillus pseudomycoides]PEI35731.1 hypothetical protein CN641_28815 [Bacillus pseudomycoides]PHE84592.1 hypothetical protein COF78_29675 [Bacillus pseudomycoides]
MAITQKDLKKEKEMVSNLLKANGQDYNHWLHLHHQKCIEEHQDLVLKALQAYKTTPMQENEVVSKANEQMQLEANEQI